MCTRKWTRLRRIANIRTKLEKRILNTYRKICAIFGTYCFLPFLSITYPNVVRFYRTMLLTTDVCQSVCLSVTWSHRLDSLTGINAAGDAGDRSPPIFWLEGTSMGISPPILLRTFGYSRPILVVLAQWQHLMMSFIHCFAQKSTICHRPDRSPTEGAQNKEKL